jgi:xanthine dehydrogenase accessory factor
MPDDAVLEIGTDERTAIVAVTHDPKLDDMALLEALKSRAFYVGALGSRANQQKRRERLRLFDLDDSQIARLHGPVGLRIASKTPAEIAVAIAGELIWVRNTLGDGEAARSAPQTSALQG